jgi:hypothetical protein
MAKATILVDDFDGSPAAETVSFALDGTTYELDLSADNAAELRETLGEWIAGARRIREARSARGSRTGRTKSRSSSNGRREKYDRTAVREWAATDDGKKALKGAKLKAPAARGRISAAVVDLYANAK